ncbi:MAG TPA: hypothetical protein PKV01_14715 [Anaerolineales bacterium]|nr:hypothetical protein [Anaerolineales bacterium]
MAKGALVVIPMISGTEEDVEASLINATFQVKDATTYKFPHPEFGAWLIEEIYAKQKINAKKEGLFKQYLRQLGGRNWFKSGMNHA